MLLSNSDDTVEPDFVCNPYVSTVTLLSPPTQSLNVLTLKPGVGQYIAIHATLTASDFLLAYFYPSGRFTCIFSKTSPDFFMCWLWLTPVPV